MSRLEQIGWQRDGVPGVSAEHSVEFAEIDVNPEETARAEEREQQV
jgi:hypothetical protein